MLHFSEEIIQLYADTKPAYQKVYNILRDSIVNGHIEHSERLTEVAVAEALDVSRTPVRAALQKLRADGILFGGKKNSSSIKQLTRKEREDLLLFDCLLEGYAAKLAAKEQDLELIAALEEIHNTMEELNRKHNLNYEEAPGMRDLSFQFHTTLAKASKNKFLYKTIVEIRTIMRMHQSPLKHRERTGGRNAILQNHRSVLECIKAGDETGAQLYMEANIYCGKDMYINAQIV